MSDFLKTTVGIYIYIYISIQVLMSDRIYAVANIRILAHIMTRITEENVVHHTKKTRQDFARPFSSHIFLPVIVDCSD